MNIKRLPSEERPREKLMTYGVNALSDSELFAVMLGTGTKGKSAVEISSDLLHSAENGLLDIADATPHELCRVSGIGQAKACKIAAAVELGKRLSKMEARHQTKRILSAEDVVGFIRADMRGLKKETFLEILVDVKGNIIAKEEISVGDLSSAPVNPREVFTVAVRKNAYGIILTHNHPSGDSAPSVSDRNVTDRMVEAGLLMGIKIIDHVIIGKNEYFSFKESGLI